MENFIKVQLTDGTEAVINKSTITKIIVNQRGTLTILFNGLGSNGFPQSLEINYPLDGIMGLLNE